MSRRVRASVHMSLDFRQTRAARLCVETADSRVYSRGHTDG